MDYLGDCGIYCKCDDPSEDYQSWLETYKAPVFDSVFWAVLDIMP